MLFLLKGVWGFPQLGPICRQTNGNLALIHKQEYTIKSFSHRNLSFLPFPKLPARSRLHQLHVSLWELSRVGLSFTHEHFSLQKHFFQGCVICARFATKRDLFFLFLVIYYGYIHPLNDRRFALAQAHPVMVMEGSEEGRGGRISHFTI